MNATLPSPAAKLSLLARVILRPGLWDAQAAAWSRLIPHDAPGDYPQHWENLVNRGDAEIFDILEPAPLNAKFVEPVRVGVLVVTICTEFPTPELILLGAFSSAKADLTIAAMPQIMQIARERGCKTVRFHTMRPGLIAKALTDGFTVSEVILRKDVPHEQ